MSLCDTFFFSAISVGYNSANEHNMKSDHTLKGTAYSPKLIQLKFYLLSEPWWLHNSF